jgi:hypothetical protein
MLRTLMILALGADPGPWGEAQVSGAGTYGSGNTTQTYTGLGSASISGFLHRLVDDGTPLLLQPYLQRAGAISGSFSLSGFITESPGFRRPYLSGLGATIEYAKGALSYDSHSVYGQWQASLSLSWWITWWLGLGVEYRFTHTEQVFGSGSVNSHRGAATLAFRLN